MEYLGFDVYEKSIHKNGEFTVFMAREGGADVIVVQGNNPGFTGTQSPGGIFKAPLNHTNAGVLRKLFPFTAPSRVLKYDRSFGVGDRLGIATPGHIRLFQRYDAYPVFAQQSVRELTLTGRTYKDVLDAASFAVFREGFKKPWGADGDHLKAASDVENALSLGFTMITLDCSEHINNNITDENAPPLPKKYADRYLGTVSAPKEFDTGETLRLSFTEGELKKIAAVYENAITFAIGIYNEFFKGGTYNADLEISIDETSTPTTPLAHYFVARELIDAGVSFATLAPRFCGEFQKGIDYKGDLAQFKKEIEIHAIIARHFDYKLSIHSGSDKFSVFPFIGKATKSRFHVKTAGTNWLEAMRVIALKAPALYREVHTYALEHAFDEARAYYHVTANLKNIPQLDTLEDGELPGLFEQDDSRQLIHITYGLILNKKNPDGSYTFKDRLYALWRDCEGDYAEALEKHIGRHLGELGVGKA
ncbi:MAG: tagaturonate epimerase family protein [Treponema sp.]|nr:tagaturonate epimerase family protein [Treponema sp.]